MPCGLRTLVPLRARSVLPLAAVVVLALAVAPTPAADTGKRPPTPNAARGLVYNGLTAAPAGSRCEGGFQLRRANGKLACTHGPDPAPPGVDVRKRRSVMQLRRDTFQVRTAGEVPPSAGSIECIGDGVSGNRVQAVYVHPAGGADRFDSVAPLIDGWAADMDGMFVESAAETGGVRHIRFVTDAQCELAIAKAAVSATAINDFGVMANELVAAGFNRDDRKYVLWVDANVFCGIADLVLDDRPTQENWSNGRAGAGPFFARTDNGCWGYAETHELVHNLGGVQTSAPNSTGFGHCTDESDNMCYQDDPRVVMEQVCPAEHEALLDCNHDDYFHTNPPDGSYLATHWNTASSSFLTDGGADTTPPSVTPPRAVFTGTAGGTALPVRVSWSGADSTSAIASYALSERVGAAAYAGVTLSGALATSAFRSVAPGQAYAYRVEAADEAGNVADAETANLVPRVYRETARAVAYSTGWTRSPAAYALGGYQKYATRQGARARFSFTGRSVAWVARRAPSNGVAHVYVDGVYAGRVSLYAATRRPRRVVFARSWPAAGSHAVKVVVAGTAGHPRVDVDGFLVLH